MITPPTPNLLLFHSRSSHPHPGLGVDPVSFPVSSTSPREALGPQTGRRKNKAHLTCVSYLFKAEEVEDAIVELHLLLVVLVHLVQDLHQLVAGLGGVATLPLVSRQLMEGSLPRAADPLVLTLHHPAHGGKSTVRQPQALRSPTLVNPHALYQQSKSGHPRKETNIGC